MKKPRLTGQDRLRIEDGLRIRKSVYAIAQELNRPARTIMREIKNRAVESDKGAVRAFGGAEPVRYLGLGGLEVAGGLAAGGEEGAVFEPCEDAVDLGG